MMRSAIAAAIAGAMAGGIGAMNPIQLLRLRESAMKLGVFGTSGRRGRGHGKKARHPSKRFVAQDKRDARRARNRR